MARACDCEGGGGFVMVERGNVRESAMYFVFEKRGLGACYVFVCFYFWGFGDFTFCGFGGWLWILKTKPKEGRHTVGGSRFSCRRREAGLLLVRFFRNVWSLPCSILVLHFLTAVWYFYCIPLPNSNPPCLFFFFF